MVFNGAFIFDFFLFAGIVNRGDSFRRRRSRSNSLIPTPTTPEPHRNGPFTSEDGLLLPSNVGFADNSSSNRSPLPSPRSSPRPTGSFSTPVPPDPDHEEVRHRVAMIGARGVGKNALVSQFMTSECINAYDHDRQNGKCPHIYTYSIVITITIVTIALRQQFSASAVPLINEKHYFITLPSNIMIVFIATLRA